MYGSTSIPSGGWLICDGSLLSTGDPQYTNLYNVIGLNYGSGPGQFQLPDLRQRFPVGSQAVISNGYNYGLGASGGEQVHTLTTAEMPAHTHDTTACPSRAFNGIGGVSQWIPNMEGPITSTTTGGGTSHNNTPLFCSVNYIIKY